MIIGAMAKDDDLEDPPPDLLRRLRELPGYSWDVPIQPFHSSYDIWHFFGTKHALSSPTQSTHEARQAQIARSHLEWNNVLSNYTTDATKSSSRRSGPPGGEVQVVARISTHALREERVFHMCKALRSTVDLEGHCVGKPIDCLRLTPHSGDAAPVSVCMFEFSGPNYLPQVLDYGPTWYGLQIIDDALVVVRDAHFVTESISLETFLDFAIGAAECIEVLHGQQLVHGEVRGDAFHFHRKDKRVRLINVGAGLRSFEHGMTSAGWSKLSQERGARTKLSYMSPEQTGRMSIEPDTRTDIFSLGVLFWTLLMQKPAFDGDTPLEVVQAVLGRQLTCVTNTRLDMPEVVGRIIDKATAKVAADRYQSVSGLRYDLVEVRSAVLNGTVTTLQNWEVGRRDVSPSFILPNIMVGRKVEHDTIVRIIENSSRSRLRDHRHEFHKERRLFPVAELAAGDDQFDDENRSVASRTLSETTSDNLDVIDAHVSSAYGGSQRNSINGFSLDQTKSSPKDLPHRLASPMDSPGMNDSLEGGSGRPISSSEGVRSALLRKGMMPRSRTRCEVITVAGALGFGKSALLQSVQVETRQLGYFASSKFDPVDKAPFKPIIKLLSSLFQQAFSESNIDHVFHHVLQQQVAPIWSVLHKVLGLPEFLFGPKILLNRVSSRSSKSSRGRGKSLVDGLRSHEPSPSSSRSSMEHGRGEAAQCAQDFLRAGSSTRSVSLINMFLDILRVFTRAKFLCFCLDDLDLADDESIELLTRIISARLNMVLILAYDPHNMDLVKLKGLLNPPVNKDRRQTGDVNHTALHLHALNDASVIEYISSTLHCTADEVSPLGRLIRIKSAGNPFYVKEMLDACYRKKCIWYNYLENGWLFDLEKISALFKARNQHDACGERFMKERFEDLPTHAKTVLAWGSLIGVKFSIRLVQKIVLCDVLLKDQGLQLDLSHPLFRPLKEQDIIEGLQAALQANIVIPTADEDVYKFVHDQYVSAAALLWTGSEKLAHFAVAQTLIKYESSNEKYGAVLASSIYECSSIIKSRIVQRHAYRKLLYNFAQIACERGVRSSAVKFFAACLDLLQDDMWNNEADDVYYDETLQIFTSAAECYIFRGQRDEAMQLLQAITLHAKTSVDKTPSWILQSRLLTQVGDSLGAFKALKACLSILDVTFDDDPTLAKCDIEFNRVCEKLKSVDLDKLVNSPLVHDMKLAAVGAVLSEAGGAAFWSDTVAFYQTALILVNKFLDAGGFPQAGMGLLQLAVVAITRHNMVQFASECGNAALALIDRWKDPSTLGKGGMIYPTFVGHIQNTLSDSVEQMESAVESATHAGDRSGSIMSFGLLGNVKFFLSEHLSTLESFCTYGCDDIPDWESDIPGGTIIIAIRQLCRALQGKTSTNSPFDIMSDEYHDSRQYKSWLVSSSKNSERPLLLYETMEIAPLFLYGYYPTAVAVGNSCLKKINALWCARNTRFLMLFHALSLAGSIWTQVNEQLDPSFRALSAQLSSEINGKSLEVGLQEEMSGTALLIKYFQRRIEQWQAVNPVNYLAWSKILAAQVAEMNGASSDALQFYEEAIDHASLNGFIFEEALASSLMGEYLLRQGYQKLAKMALLEATDLYRQIGASGVAHHIEDKHHALLRKRKLGLQLIDTGVQTDFQDDSDVSNRNNVNHESQNLQLTQFASPSGDHNLSPRQEYFEPANEVAGHDLHMFDWTTILESSQVISSVLQIDQLLKTMCEIILQNCKGVADLAAIIIKDKNSESWVVAASGESTNGARSHDPPVSLELSRNIADNVVKYCTRFKEVVFLPDLMQDIRFSNVKGTWTTQNPTSKSVIAFPILHGDIAKPLLGVLYLEGHPNAFTKRNLEVMQLLVNQIGISYANALTLEEANTAKAAALSYAKLAEEAAKAKTTFLANISHELRTPLNGVIGNSELLLNSNLEKIQAEMADSIRVSADLLLILINDILDLSKMEAHKMELHMTDFDLSEMLQEIVRSTPHDNRTKMTSKGVHIIQDFDLPGSLVFGDPIRLRQILGNLVGNSFKFTESGSVTIGARVESETDTSAQMNFWVKDTGIGISAQQLQKLFQPFSQADSSTARKYGGSGLGLSICKALVESMGGTIKLESVERKGTTASFSINFLKAKVGEPESNGIKESVQAAPKPHAIHAREEYYDLAEITAENLRICIAEDNAINQKVALRFLEKMNFKGVDTYENGLAAVEGIRKKADEGRPYHIVLMDVSMPVMDGYEATETIRRDPQDAVRKILIIALTASAVQGDREKCLALGMNDYLAKPVRLTSLKSKFSQYIRV